MSLGLTPTTLSFIAGNGSPAPSAGVTDVLQNGVSVVDNGVARVTVPVKTSDLQNDSGFITEEDIPAIPTKTSQLQNDSGFVTSSAIPTKTSDLQNDSGFITSSSLPTVDQTYNSASTNAQSGVAVAQAIASITPGGSGSLSYHVHLPNTENETVVSNITPGHSTTVFSTGIKYEMPAASANDVLVGGSGSYVGASGVIRIVFTDSWPSSGNSISWIYLFVNDPTVSGYTGFQRVFNGKTSWETSTVEARIFDIPYVMNRQVLSYSDPVEIYVFYKKSDGTFIDPEHRPEIIFYKFA